jgi:acyl-coenzyme A synthetase/AMP-(fatty) acid ligase
LPGIFAFVVLKEGIKTTDEEIEDQLRKAVKKAISSYAQPDFILVSGWGMFTVLVTAVQLHVV